LGSVDIPLGVLCVLTGVATCEECEGKWYQASVLEYHLGGKNISEVLAMSVTEAQEFFGATGSLPPSRREILDTRDGYPRVALRRISSLWP